MAPTDLLRDLVDWGEKAARVAARTDRRSIAGDEQAELALARAVEVVGEISGRLLLQHHERWKDDERVELQAAYRMRNRLAHGYDAISPAVLFDVAVVDVARLTIVARLWLVELDANQP